MKGADASELGERAKVSLTLIVRDEEENLPRCLESVRGIFDEIVVVGTGSVDRTKEIAREFGAKVFDFVWVDDFAAARSEALNCWLFSGPKSAGAGLLSLTRPGRVQRSRIIAAIVTKIARTQRPASSVFVSLCLRARALPKNRQNATRLWRRVA